MFKDYKMYKPGGVAQLVVEPSNATLPLGNIYPYTTYIALTFEPIM